MIEIKDLLLRFQNLLGTGESKKNLIAETISSVVGIKINTEDVEIKNGSVYLDIKPIYKSEIFRRKEEIFIKLTSALGNDHLKDIK